MTHVEKKADDRLAPYRHLIGLPVVVQFGVMPYLQVVPQCADNGKPFIFTVPIPTDDPSPEAARATQVGVPQATPDPTATATGVLAASECGQWIIIEEQIPIPRTAEYVGGLAKVHVYARPEAVAFITVMGKITPRS